MDKKINERALGYSGAVLGALCMLILGLFGNLGLYMGAVKLMQQSHMFFTLSAGGIILCMIEAAIISFLLMYMLAWIYNKFI